MSSGLGSGGGEDDGPKPVICEVCGSDARFYDMVRPCACDRSLHAGCVPALLAAAGRCPRCNGRYTADPPRYFDVAPRHC